MCARYTVYTEEEIIEMRSIIDEISRKFGGGAVSEGEIAPTDSAPVLTVENGALVPRPAIWGFPKREGRGVIINARSESALQRPFFSESLLHRRCVIPTAGFYEWALSSVFGEQISMLPSDESPAAGKSKVKLFFRRPGEKMLYMAGMINTYRDRRGATRDVFCILTTEAKHAMTRFHSRMPVILEQSELMPWLGDDFFMRSVLLRDGAELEWERAV